jgi:hypothetical protein
MAKSCKKGYYYCHTDKKCKKIPKGWHVMPTGYIMRDSEHKDENKDETEGKKKNGNGNGANGNGNGNGGSNGGSDGGGVSESKDHEVAMAQSQLKKSAENIKKLRKALGKKEKDIPAWMQAKITDTAHDTDAAAGYVDKMDEEVIAEKRDGKSAKDKGYSLRDWFKGGGWVQAGGKYDGKPCAKQPGQKTKPFCRDADDRANMSKKERSRRAAKKRREDPNPDREGKAKMVSASYSNWRAEFLEGYRDDGDIIRPGDKILRKNKKVLSDDDIKRMKDKGIPLDKAHYEPQGELVDEGKKDACYHKVKSRYKVWPSAYASGALVKCRKVGAKNWGNSKKNESYEISNWRDDFQATEYESIDIIKPEPLQPTQGLGSEMLEEGGKKCWKGYKKAGTQKLFGKTYNRCVKAHFSDWRADMDLQEKKAKKDYDGDGKIESGSEEYLGSRDKAIKKAMGKKNCGCGKEICETYGKQEVKEDWQKSNRKDGVDGMSQKSVNAYKRENPGSKLQTAVTEKKPTGKRAKRRTSFCARSKGQKDMHNIDCSKTPEKKICKARKRWRC